VTRREPSFPQGGYPEPAAEVSVPERPTGGAGEHEPGIARPGMTHDVSGQIRCDQLGYRHTALTSPGLRRAEHEPAAAPLVKLPRNADRPCLIVDVGTPQRRQLTQRRLVKAASSTKTR
jgi:hypothetical protein